jgi:hypothetical protein
VTEQAGTVPELLSQKDARWNGVLEPFQMAEGMGLKIMELWSP